MKNLLVCVCFAVLLILCCRADSALAGSDGSDVCEICNGTGLCTICGGSGIYSQEYNIPCYCSNGKCEYCNGTGSKRNLAAPAISAAVLNDGSVSIVYSASDSRAYGASIYRIDSDGEETIIEFSKRLSGKFVDSDAKPGRKYRYYARIEDVNDNYGKSDEIEIITPFTDVPAVGDEGITGLPNAVKLSFKFSGEVSRLEIYRSSKKGSGYKKIAELTEFKKNSFDNTASVRLYDDNVKTGKKYYYKARGVSCDGLKGQFTETFASSTKASKGAGKAMKLPDFSKFSGLTGKQSSGKAEGSGAEYIREEYENVPEQAVLQYLNLLSENSSYQLRSVGNNNIVYLPDFFYYTSYMDYTGKGKLGRGAGCDITGGLLPCDVSVAYCVRDSNKLIIQYSKDFKKVTPKTAYNRKTALPDSCLEKCRGSVSLSVTPSGTWGGGAYGSGRCDLCHGSGRCPVCNGRGPTYITGYGVTPGKYVYCTTCHGDNKCYKCGGTGGK